MSDSRPIPQCKTNQQVEDEISSSNVLRTSLFLRSLALARLSLGLGAGFMGGRVDSLLSSEKDAPEKIKERLIDQAKMLAKELGQLKGSVMKVGQMLSVYGERLLPPEANEILKTLQCQAPPLDWQWIQPVIQVHLGQDRLARLVIETRAEASASLGQVHSAILRESGHRVAVKVQYPGVDRAVASDLKTLKTLFTLAHLMPQIPHLDRIIHEVQDMLHQELDYRQEAEFCETFRNLLINDPRYVVPKVHPEYSSAKVLTSDFIEGSGLDSPAVFSLSQERRDALALAALELYFREIFEFKMVQTDPHFGNYRVQLATSSSEPDRLVLFDFGAVRRFDENFVEKYRQLTVSALSGDYESLRTTARSLGFLEPNDPEELVEEFTRFCFLMVEPFGPAYVDPNAKQFLSSDGGYDWAASNLPTRLSHQLGRVIAAYKLRLPPREMIFLDRKTSGLFILMSTLRARVGGGDLLRKIIKFEQ